MILRKIYFDSTTLIYLLTLFTMQEGTVWENYLKKYSFLWLDDNRLKIICIVPNHISVI